jgi:tripartite-type tricarboxylate transporter receptor subunit TctC
MELIIILLLIGAIVWVIWRARASIRAEKMAALDDAWRTVLSDPNYERRRQQEESKARSRK